jgi:group I intron endonuclease
MTISGIYMIRHKDSGKCYIGRSVDIHNRWNLHKRHTEQNRDRSPLHRAMRKYGYDAFEWLVICEASAELHVVLEERFIKEHGTMVPVGYNVGGAAGGMPPKELLALMGDEERQTKLAEMRGLATKMHCALADLRKDPKYDAAYRAAKSEAAKRRWALRKARMASDPAFAAEANKKWLARAAKAAETIKKRMATEEGFSRHIHVVRSASAKKARSTDPRTLAANARKVAA